MRCVRVRRSVLAIGAGGIDRDIQREIAANPRAGSFEHLVEGVRVRGTVCVADPVRAHPHHGRSSDCGDIARVPGGLVRAGGVAARET